MGVFNSKPSKEILVLHEKISMLTITIENVKITNSNLTKTVQDNMTKVHHLTGIIEIVNKNIEELSKISDILVKNKNENTKRYNELSDEVKNLSATIENILFVDD